jgi:NitT/TauT family transport system permease protein
MSAIVPLAGEQAAVNTLPRRQSTAQLRVRSAVPGVLLVVVLLVVWIVAHAAGHISTDKLPAPIDVARAGWSNRSQLISAGLDTLEGALGGFLLGSAVAVAVAILVASSTIAARLLLPVALVVRTLPIIAIAPLLTLLLGYGEITIVSVAAMIIFFPTLVNAVLGLRSVSPETIELMSTANASRLQMLWKVRLPTALPYVFSGLQIGAATCILGAMVAEWVTTGTGLGYLILKAGIDFEVPLMWAGVIFAAILAILVFALTGWIARRVVYEASA